MSSHQVLKRIWVLAVFGAVGCGYPMTPPAAAPTTPPAEQPSRLPERHSQATPKPEVSFDTAHDGRFAEFVADKSAEMVKKVAVGIEHRGVMRVEVGESVDPEDVLPLTKSLVAGARKDFPGKAFTLSVYDRHDQPILKAHFNPDQGVHYEVAGSESGQRHAQAEPERPKSGAALPPKGTTEKDRHFAEWAMGTAPKYLRYVQADLDKRGRLWFGVTRDVRAEDLPDLTKSLLQGAHKEFPRRELTATAFDPDGERIGRATLSADGRVHWSR